MLSDEEALERAMRDPDAARQIITGLVDALAHYANHAHWQSRPQDLALVTQETPRDWYMGEHRHGYTAAELALAEIQRLVTAASSDPHGR